MNAIGRLVNWLCLGDVGTSSKAIVYVMHGLPPKLFMEKHWSGCYPHDRGDFGRCYSLLSDFPEWKSRILEMKCLGKTWELISQNWEALTTLYENGEYEKLYKLLNDLESKESGFEEVKIKKGVSCCFKK